MGRVRVPPSARDSGSRREDSSPCVPARLPEGATVLTCGDVVGNVLLLLDFRSGYGGRGRFQFLGLTDLGHAGLTAA